MIWNYFIQPPPKKAMELHGVDMVQRCIRLLFILFA